MERIPTHSDTSIFTVPLVALTRLCCRCPVTVLVLSVALAAFGAYWAYGHLGFKMSRLDLINPNSGFNRLWLDYIDEFGDSDEVIIVAEGKNNVEVIPVLDALSKRVAAFPDEYQGVLHGIDISKIKRKGLHYVPEKELEEITEFAAQSAVLTKHWEYLAADKMLGGMMQKKDLHEIETYITSLAKAFDATPAYNSPFPAAGAVGGSVAGVPDVVAACSQNDTNYFLFPTDNGVMGFVLLKLAKVDKTQMAQGTESINRLRSLIEDIRQKNPGVQIGLTGMPILENDEMRLSSEAMNRATVLALFGVAAVFMAGFGGIRHPLFGMFALIAAFAWTMGYITLVIGHLNILSISFGAMLAGLGTDFSVHYIARYLDLRRAGYGTEEALCETAGEVGPGIFTGAITTALAFYTASFCEFTGISELGTISGGGVMLCALSTFVMVPAFIMLSDKNVSGGTCFALPKLLDIRGGLTPVVRFPRWTLAVAGVFCVFLCFGIPKVWYDYNLLHLQPVGLESVELEQKLLDRDADKGGKNVWYALSIADTKDDLLKRKKEFSDKYPELTVEEIVSWFPAAGEKKIALIQHLASSLAELPERPSDIPVPAAENIGQMLFAMQNTLQGIDNEKLIIDNAEQRKQLSMINDQLSAIRNSLRRMGSEEYQTRMRHYQQAVAGDLLTRLQTLKTMAAPEPPAVNDLPESLVQRFVGKSGKQLMRIYTTANIWNMDEMQAFVQKVRSIDPKATGSPLQTYESSLQMQKGFITAAGYAFAAILLILLLDFRSVNDVLLAVSPMFAGFILMFGILGWLNLPLNPANMIVLPLILGIGVDDGVHLVHEYRQQKRAGYAGGFRLSSSTATSILITSLTTFIGFGSMMIASHRGLQSLGRVLVIGVAACLFTSLVAMPALLVLRSKKYNVRLAEPLRCREETTAEENDKTNQDGLDDAGDCQLSIINYQSAKPKRLVRRAG
ncbi:MAG: MMPL family transporter [Planctomycetaceae bacterium]|jgi:hopanoid biosynthesis associated RND transporter like protein HpnN|nr:MMPL family transporter [Planctomycetaceae bacterium]